MGAFAGTALFTAIAGVFESIRVQNFHAFKAFGASVILLGVRVLILMIPAGLVIHGILYAIRQRGILGYVIVAVLCGGLFGGFGPLGELEPIKSAIVYGLWAGCCAAIAWLIRGPDHDGQAEAK